MLLAFVNLDVHMKLTTLAAVLAFLVTSPATAKTLWSIYWTSDPLPCGKGWDTPMIFARAPCNIKDVAVSICPKTEGDTPFDQGKPITIVGYELIQILSVPTAQGYMVIGSGHGEDGADVFAMTGGVGTNSSVMTFPPDIGLPQGAMPVAPGYAHIDVYGSCTGGGTQQALVTILYTSP